MSNKVEVYARFPLGEEELEKIRGILRESNCVNESMRNTFPSRYHGVNGNSYHFDKWYGDFKYDVEY